MCLPAWVDFGRHASELACVAIGMNLLFPAAPSFYGRFLKNVETDPAKLYRHHFAQFKGDLTSDEARRIGVLANEIEKRRCPDNGHWAWTAFELASVLVGCHSLWCGFVDRMGGWSVLLFTPVVSLVAYTGVCSLYCRRRLHRAIDNVAAAVSTRSRGDAPADNDEFVQSFADKMLKHNRRRKRT